MVGVWNTTVLGNWVLKRTTYFKSLGYIFFTTVTKIEVIKKV